MVADPGSRDEIWIVKMQCDLVDAWFMGVCGWKHKYEIIFDEQFST